MAKRLGFKGAKIPLPYSHAEGGEGLRKNVDAVRKARDSVGPDFPLMIDCYMSLVRTLFQLTSSLSLSAYISLPRTLPLRRLLSLSGQTVPYTIELARALEPLKVRWIEECLPPDDYEGYAQLKKSIHSTMITTGEHEYTRYGFRELISRKCAGMRSRNKKRSRQRGERERERRFGRVADNAADILQPDITWVGGLTEARKMAAPTRLTSK